MKKALCILGPTAVGKTALSLFLAPHFQGVIFSADSIQVYNGLDIISGKDKDSYGDSPVEMLDLVSPKYSFNVSDYVRTFRTKLKNIKPDQMPIIVGGTGFYISALINGVETSEIKPDKKLRKFLEGKNVKELQEILSQKNPEKFLKMNSSDRDNPRRLVRAIEIASINQNSKSKTPNVKKPLENFDIKIIGLILPKNELDKRIDERVEKRMEDGALGEAQSLFKGYKSLSTQIKRANGYKQLFAYLENETTLEKAIELWKIAEHQNAKKQMTFFKKIKNIAWFNFSKKPQKEILAYVQEWYNKNK